MATSSELLIETTNLAKRYNKRKLAVDTLNLAVQRGEVYGFLGPNGAGKTTTLRMLTGLIRPTSGKVRVVGSKPGDPEGLARLGSMVEAPAFYPYLSGRDNLRAIALLVGAPFSRVEEVLDTVKLSYSAKEKFGVYSTGMKQRLGVAAALLKKPELFILDEPTNGLDPGGIVDMRELIRKLGDTGHTVLLSSHDMGEIEQICDRVGVISRGRMVAEGTVKELVGEGELLINAEPLSDARRLVERVTGVESARVENGVLLMRADAALVPDLLSEFVRAGIRVSEVRRQERKLEDVFLELTGEPPQEDESATVATEA